MKNKQYYWTTKDGRKIPVEELDLQHLRNIVKMYIRDMEESDEYDDRYCAGDYQDTF